MRVIKSGSEMKSRGAGEGAIRNKSENEIESESEGGSQSMR